MGNGLNKTLDRWGVNPQRFIEKNKKKKGGPVETQQYSDVHIYDSVPDEGPVYAQVKRRHNSEGLHYVDVEVLQSRSATTRGGQSTATAHPTHRGVADTQRTEYATINFNPFRSRHGQQHQLSPSPKMSSQPADILIPPGVLLTPNPLQKTRAGSAHSALHKPVVV